MPINSVRDNENNRWKGNVKKPQKTKAEKNKGGGRGGRGGDRSYGEKVRANWFCCPFKFGFLQLIYKTFLIFKSNLQLALSIILKKRELYVLKHVIFS